MTSYLPAWQRLHQDISCHVVSQAVRDVDIVAGVWTLISCLDYLYLCDIVIFIAIILCAGEFHLYKFLCQKKKKKNGNNYKFGQTRN